MGTPSFQGSGERELSPELLLRILEKMERNLERLEERLGSVEKEIASLRVWYGVVAFVIPSLLLAVIVRGLAL